MKTQLSDIQVPDLTTDEFVAVSLGDFTLTGELGRGGMGVVYEAEQRSLNRKVAIKMLPSAVLSGNDSIERFRKEAEATAAIDHPNIVPIYEVGETEGQPYMAMKLIEGQPLSMLVRQLRGNQRKVVKLMTKVCDAVFAAHKLGILHRDLKPGNILVEAEIGEPHVADFGLAKRLDEEQDSQLTMTGQVLGTPGFMAPEQARGDQVSTAADVYSLGAILYELLTGKTPFSGQNVAQILRQIEEDPPERPSSTAKGVDGDLEAITMKCLEKDPPLRYASASDLAKDLNRWLRGEPVHARRVSSVGRALRWSKRKPVQAALAITATLFVLTLAIGGPIVAIHQAKLRAELRRQLYFSEMAAAYEASVTPSGFPKVRQLLENWGGDDSADLRGWEWRYLDNLTQPSGDTFISAGYPIRAFALTPDAERYAIVKDNCIEVRSVADHQLVWRSKRISGRIYGLSFSHDSRFLSASATHTSRVLVFDLNTDGEPMIGPGVTAGASDPWSPNAALLVAQHHKKVKVLKSDGSILSSFSPLYYSDYHFDWLPDGSCVLLHFPPDKTVLIPSEESSTEPIVHQLGESLQASVLKLSPSGATAAIGDLRGNVRLLDIKSMELSPKIAAHESKVNCVAWSPDGRQFATVGDDYSLQIHDPDSNTTTNVLRGHLGPIHGVLWAEADRILTWSEDGTVRTWQPRSKPQIRTGQPHHLASVSWNPDGTRLTAAYSDMVTIDLSDPDPTPERHLIVSDATNDLVWMPNGRDVAIFVLDQVVICPPGSIQANQLPADIKRLHRHDPIGHAIELHPTKPWLASAGSDGVRISDYESGEQILEVARTGVHHLRFHPKEQQLLAFASQLESEIQFVDVESGEVQSVVNPSGAHAWALDFHPNGKLFATGSANGVIEVWSHPDCKRASTLLGHTGEVTALTFSPDGKRLASASLDTTIRIWDVESCAEICALRGHRSGVLSIAWSPDGESLASCGQAGEAKIWSAN
ncbi:MAG: protein kinase [Verrucomicrobiota bacterium]